MRLLLASLALVITGCSTTAARISAPWPAAPQELLAAPCKLQELPQDQQQLSQLLSNANTNYACAHATRDQVESWQQWYNSQKAAFDALKK